MKRTLRPKNVIAALTLAVFAACGGCDDTGSNGNNQNNGNNDNNGGSCLLGTDCPSGVCENGTCAIEGDNNCADPGPCGNCDPFCERDTAGDDDNPFVIDDNPDDDQTSQGVVLDDDGAITLDVRRIETNFIWISNTGEGTVSKVDTRTYEEVARYISGPDGTGNDPSRTSVNTYGDVYVGNRSGTSVTKISTLGADCPDTNGDGMITTSQGPTDVLAWGQDDCVLWNTDLPNGGIIRAVAAQDGHPSDDTLRPGVWIGGWGGIVWKLDSDTGAILVETNSPVTNYGFALDGLGNLWISGWTDGGLGRIDTLRCVDTATCNAAMVCDREDGDDCIKQRIAMPHRPYGITVDFKQRVWTGGDSTSRYDPSLAVGSRFVHVASGFMHGIAADDKGFVWSAGMSLGVIRYDADDPNQNLAVAGSEQSAKGMAIDLDGKIWSINQQDASATVIIPGAALADHQVLANQVTGFVAPYTYSDMTGAQLRFVTDERGYYRRVYEGCTSDQVLETEWQNLQWDAETPGDSRIVFRGRSANTRDGLAAQPWVLLATQPPDTSPKEIAAALEAANQQGLKYIEIEAQLEANRVDDETIHVPRLLAMAVTYRCPINIQ